MARNDQLATVEGGREVEQFDPQQARKRDAATDAEITYAKRVRDWPMLRDAIKRKLDDQAEFVEWWTDKVRGAGKVNSRRTGRIEMEAAEKATQVSHQQVSKVRSRSQAS